MPVPARSRQHQDESTARVQRAEHLPTFESEANGTGFSNYTLSFMTKIVRGGTGWRVASGVTPYGALFYLTSNYPEHNTFVNVNRTLLPPNSLVYNYGYSIVNQSTLTTGWNEYFPVNLTIEEGVWYNISTTISPSEYQVFLNGTKLATVSFYQANLLATASRSGSGSRAPRARRASA